MSHEVLMGSGDRKTAIGERLVESTGGWSVINNGRFLSVTNVLSSGWVVTLEETIDRYATSLPSIFVTFL